MLNTNNLLRFSETLEKAFEAVDNPELLPLINKTPKYLVVSIEEKGRDICITIPLNDIDPDELNLECDNGQLTLATLDEQLDDADLDTRVLPSLENQPVLDDEQAAINIPFSYHALLPQTVEPDAVITEFVDDCLEIQLVRRADSPLLVSA